MPPSLFLLGVDHGVQCGGKNRSPQQAEEFVLALGLLCDEHRIRRIVEEMDEDGRIHYDVEKTLVAEVAMHRGLAHCDLDLTRSVRKTLAMSDATLFAAKNSFRQKDGGSRHRSRLDQIADEIRERIWALRILETSGWPVLFVLGSHHVASFAKLWRRLRICPVVVVDTNAA